MQGSVVDGKGVYYKRNTMELVQTTFPFLVFSGFTPLALFFLRVILAIMFVDSGRRHLQDPTGRAAGLGLPVWCTILLGIVEVVGGLLILVGFLTHYAAFLLSGVMLGAIYFKVVVWKTGIYGAKNDGWYYDALLLAGTGILFAVGAGTIAIDAVLY